jgi:glycosyltransferase involved in cell wall biosynthesis
VSRIVILHLLDTLETGGTEVTAVRLVNHLPRDRFAPWLATSRREGPLADRVRDDVGRLALARRGRFDLAAVRRLAAFLTASEVRLVHAHGPSLFLARAAVSVIPRAARPAVLWHVHAGRYAREGGGLYGLATRGIEGAIAVSDPLAHWCRERLGLPPSRVWSVPNPVVPAQAGRGEPPGLPPREGPRIVCVASLRPEKGHLTLVRAVAQVAPAAAGATLLLVGAERDPVYAGAVRAEVEALGLGGRVAFLGLRQDVPAILAASDVGVLSSDSEGFPLALVEYGQAGLPTVATRVGQCGDLLGEGRCGLLVSPRHPAALAAALLRLLGDPAEAARLGARFLQSVEDRYGVGSVVGRMVEIYDEVLSRSAGWSTSTRSTRSR